jgi:hypothetical protein
MTDMEPLTDEQIKNWRNVLCLSVGPWAFMMPAHEIELIVVSLQQYINAYNKYTKRRAAEDARTAKESARQAAKQTEIDKRLASLADRVAGALETTNHDRTKDD